MEPQKIFIILIVCIVVIILIVVGFLVTTDEVASVVVPNNNLNTPNPRSFTRPVADVSGTKFVLFNETECQVETMIAAIESQLRNDFYPHWGKPAAINGPDANWTVDGNINVPVDCIPIFLVRTGDMSKKIVAYRDVVTDFIHDNGVPKAYVVTPGSPYIVIYYNNTIGLLSRILSHQILETLVNPYGTFQAIRKSSGIAYSLDICAPLEKSTSSSYNVTVGDEEVAVASFVYPEWFKTYSTQQVDHVAACTEPFQVIGNTSMFVRKRQISIDLVDYWLNTFH